MSEFPATSYSHCPQCGQQTFCGQFLCGHTAHIEPKRPKKWKGAAGYGDATVDNYVRAMEAESAALREEIKKLTLLSDSQLANQERLTEDQIKYMVDRFLGWRLPENFNPDGGISFKKTFNEHTTHPMKHEPTGTNLFDSVQAETMIRYLVDGMLRGEVVMMCDEHGFTDCAVCNEDEAQPVAAVREALKVAREENDRQQRTMKFWEESYLKEHEHWGICKFRLEVEELRANQERLVGEMQELRQVVLQYRDGHRKLGHCGCSRCIKVDSLLKEDGE